MSEMIEPTEVFQTTPPATPLSLSEGQIEAMVTRQVEAILEKMARNLLPDIAEKLIKQEIHRMLSE